MRIVIAMSGGVDSSVAALLLKEKGYDPIGITMKTWPKEECGSEGEKLCCSLESIGFARSVAEDIGIPYYVVDYSKEFESHIKKYFEEEYAKGRTPNPCVYCNSKLKFGALLDKAKELGAEKIATGHYANIIQKEGKTYLSESRNSEKDQSYFLFDIPKEKLSQIEFPLGDMTKEEVREIATRYGLMPADRPASQDICFATSNGGYKEYLMKAGVKAFTEGDIVDLSGKVLGKHSGIASYTVGQRKGLGVAHTEPLYVIEINVEKNIVIVGEKSEAMKSKIRVSGFNWLTIDKLDKEYEFDVRIRYNGKRVKSKITPEGDSGVVEFREKQFAPTPGQAVVFYDDNIVVGGGWIDEVIS